MHKAVGGREQPFGRAFSLWMAVALTLLGAAVLVGVVAEVRSSADAPGGQAGVVDVQVDVSINTPEPTATKIVAPTKTPDPRTPRPMPTVAVVYCSVASPAVGDVCIKDPTPQPPPTPFAACGDPAAQADKPCVWETPPPREDRIGT